MNNVDPDLISCNLKGFVIMRLAALCDAVNARPVGDLSVEINYITNNSKDVKAGSLFVCIPGLRADGHDFAPEAVKNGAVALILERDVPCRCPKLFVNNARVAQAMAGSCFYGNPTSMLDLIGVTGTNGKTTITYMIESILKAAVVKCGVIGTINYRYPDHVVIADRTTPDSVKLQMMFREMLDAGVEAVVMEVSSHALDLNRVDGCEFDTVILTNITHDHFDFHKDFASYLRSKQKLFEIAAVKNRKQTEKTAVINNDDVYGRSFIKKIPYKVITYAIDNPADVSAYNILLGTSGCSFDLYIKDRFISRIELGMPGRANIYNAMAAIACTVNRCNDIEIIKKGLRDLPRVPGRFELVDCGQPFTVIVDFAHNPDGLTKLLSYCNKNQSSKRIVVFGCEGGGDTSKRSVMGEIAAKYADISIITTDNMYSESAEKVTGEIEQGFKSQQKIRDIDYFIIPNRLEAIKTALAMAEKGDEVLIAGKGHETVQYYYGKVIPFNDKEIIKGLLSSYS